MSATTDGEVVKYLLGEPSAFDQPRTFQVTWTLVVDAADEDEAVEVARGLVTGEFRNSPTWIEEEFA